MYVCMYVYIYIYIYIYYCLYCGTVEIILPPSSLRIKLA